MKHLCLCSIKVLLAKIIRYPIAPKQHSSALSLLSILQKRLVTYMYSRKPPKTLQLPNAIANNLPGASMLQQQTTWFFKPPYIPQNSLPESAAQALQCRNARSPLWDNPKRPVPKKQ